MDHLNEVGKYLNLLFLTSIGHSKRVLFMNGLEMMLTELKTYMALGRYSSFGCHSTASFNGFITDQECNGRNIHEINQLGKMA